MRAVMQTGNPVRAHFTGVPCHLKSTSCCQYTAVWPVRRPAHAVCDVLAPGSGWAMDRVGGKRFAEVRDSGRITCGSKEPAARAAMCSSETPAPSLAWPRGCDCCSMAINSCAGVSCGAGSGSNFERLGSNQQDKVETQTRLKMSIELGLRSNSARKVVFKVRSQE